jgi:competence protein ComGC
MKKLCTLAIVLALTGTSFLLVEGCKEKTTTVESGKTSSAEKNSFKEVTSKLDAGGSFYLYLSTEQWLNNLSGKIGNLHQLVSSLPDVQDQQQDIDKAFNAGIQLIKDSGLEQISGIGMSSIAREPGFYHNKLIIHHYAGQGNGFIWTIFGKEPHELTAVDLLPTNTAMAAFYDVDAPQVWAIIEKEFEQSGFPQAKDSLDRFRWEFAQGAGMKWEDAVGSLGGEFGFVVTLEPSRMITVALPSQEPLDVPEPGLMLVAKVKNDAIFDRIDAALAKSGQHVIREDKDGVKMRTVPVPIPLVTLRPSVAAGGGYLFIATTDGLIREALAVKGGKPGLKSTDEFKKLAEGLPQRGNQFCFLSSRFGQTIAKIQQQVLSMHQDATPPVRQLLQSLVRPESAAFTLAVGANTDEGWMTVANGNQGSGNVLAASVVVPGLLAAIAVPNFIKARDTAQKNRCINNLRQIDAAKQQWALEKNKTASDVPTWEDLQPYLGKSKVPLHCPKGGEYTIGAVNQQPTCSIAEHVLPSN